MKFQEFSGIPLRRIIYHLDVDSVDNLLDATEGTEMGLEMVNMARKQQYACPVCVIEKFTNNVEEVFRQQPEMSQQRRMVQMDCFGFFFQFMVSDRGANNYNHEILCIDEDDRCISRLKKLGGDRKVYFTGCYDYKPPSYDWLAMIEEMKKKQGGENSVFLHEFTRMYRMLFGGTFDGITIRPTLQLYTRRDLERHICRGHNLDDSNDLNLREFWIWTEKWGRLRTFTVPTMWFNQDREINLQSLDEFIKRVATAKYYNDKRRTIKFDFARQVVGKELHIMLEALDIFRLAYEAFYKLRFTIQFSRWHELRLLNYYNMIRLTLEALLE